jgi:gliding motility-associated lipoprotein GldH
MYESYLDVNSKGWHQDSTASFEVTIDDTTAAYMVIFNLRANDDYPYSNLYLFREIQSETVLEYQDTAAVKLADEYGRWLGDGLGELKTFSRAYRAQPLRFNRRGTYTFSFTHAMRVEVLKGVEDVGLTLYKKEDGKD